MRKLAILLALVVAASAPAPGHAAQRGGNFNSFLAQMARDAQAQGISQAVVAQAFAGVTQDAGHPCFRVQ